MDRTREREERTLFHRVVKKLVKRKSVKYQFCHDEKSWTLDFVLKLKGQIAEISGS